MLSKTDYRDFGKEVFPASIRSRHVQMHLYDGYWEDIGTIASFYEANLQLAQARPPFELVTADAPIYSRARFLPPSQFEGATIRSSLIADGCQIASGAVIENSVIGVRCRIGPNATIRNSVIMGNDFYQSSADIEADHAAGCPPIGIGEGTLIDGAIVDKNCRLGRNVRIENDRQQNDTPETPEGWICDGVFVVPKEATLPDGWTM